jgi:predicted AAA+ superfamily ATPase
MGDRFDTGISRDALNAITPWITSGKALAICGMRRSGKTTLLRQVVAHLIGHRDVPARDILFVNLEDPVFIETQDSPSFLDDLLQAFLEHSQPKGTPHLFLDEIQNVGHWARWVRSAVDRGTPHIYLSGSSSHLLEPDLAAVLTGRHHQITLWPFSFREVCRARGLPLIPGSYQPKDEQEARALLADFLQNGGLPEVVLGTDPARTRELPKDLFRDILYRDIVSRHPVRAVGALEEIAQYLLANTAHLFTYNRLKDRFGLGIDQVRNYIEYLEQSYVIGQLQKFDFKVAKQSRAPRKVYASDTGLRNAVSFRFSADIGWLAETIVYRQLRENAEGKLFYYLGKQECDFVVWQGDHASRAIQVCYAQDPIPDRERTALLKAMDALDLSSGLILTDRTEREDQIEGRVVRHQPLWRWLMQPPEPDL